jgi:hypothetical protein
VITDVTPQLAYEYLSKLSRELDIEVYKLGDVAKRATDRRMRYELAYSEAFLRAAGSMDLRKHLALVETHNLRVEAEHAKDDLDTAKLRIRAMETRIGAGRSLLTTLRAEIDLVRAG